MAEYPFLRCRLCQPWITLTILRGTFGELADDVAARFLLQHIPGRYIFRPQYDRSEIVISNCHYFLKPLKFPYHTKVGIFVPVNISIVSATRSKDDLKIRYALEDF